MMNKFRNELEGMLDNAFNELYEKDKYLINHEHIDISKNKDGHVSERSIVARFAIYMQAYLNENNCLKNYNLDVEYNRNLDGAKTLPDSPWKDNGAYPDLIIHKRGSNCGNILIIEFKTYWNKTEDNILSDIKKLKAFKKKPYYYENALFVLINENCKKYWWIEQNTNCEEIVCDVQGLLYSTP